MLALIQSRLLWFRIIRYQKKCDLNSDRNMVKSNNARKNSIALPNAENDIKMRSQQSAYSWTEYLSKDTIMCMDMLREINMCFRLIWHRSLALFIKPKFTKLIGKNWQRRHPQSHGTRKCMLNDKQSTAVQMLSVHVNMIKISGLPCSSLIQHHSSADHEVGDMGLYMPCSATLLLTSSRNELKPVELDNHEPSKDWSSTRYFSNTVVSSCAPWMSTSLGVMFLSCFNLSIVDLSRPVNIFHF